MILLALAVFAASLTYVFISTKAWYATEERKAHHAAAFESLLDGLEWVFVFLLVKISLLLALPSIAGTYVGVWLGVRYAKRKDLS